MSIGQPPPSPPFLMDVPNHHVYGKNCLINRLVKSESLCPVLQPGLRRKTNQDRCNKKRHWSFLVGIKTVWKFTNLSSTDPTLLVRTHELVVHHAATGAGNTSTPTNPLNIWSCQLLGRGTCTAFNLLQATIHQNTPSLPINDSS